MLIPSIDIQGGRIVQLVQGDRLAIASDDLDGWIERFASYPTVQLIDLDAAMGVGENDAIIRHVASRLPCQIGGGIRTIDRARALLDAGAKRVILGSALFASDRVAIDRARRFAEAIGSVRLIAAVDARGGFVAIHGWKTITTVAVQEAIEALSPYVDAFLYTHIDTEGTLSGLDPAVVSDFPRTTTRRLIVAGGIRSQAEVDTLGALGIDAVVGMAIYTGLLKT